MSSIMNIGTRALLANQDALQTIGNNIANVNTVGYSRQSVVLESIAGQFTGSGYYGKGVDVKTVQRSYDEFLTRQAIVSKSLAAADTTRFTYMNQLENVFQGGPDGLGAAINNMLNAYSDVVSAPTDLTARTVVLTRAEEAANRFQTATVQLNDLKVGVAEQLKNNVTAVNSLSSQIAKINDQIALALGSGQAPNDLLDKRDQMISDLNRYVQTTQVKADDGSINLFLAGSQPLVLGNRSSPVSIENDEFGNPAKSDLAINLNGTLTHLNPTLLGGGEIGGLLRFQNTDLVDATNLLGRMALAIGTTMNQQQALGLDANGNIGGAMFNLSPAPQGYAATGNSSPGTVLNVGVTPGSGASSLSPSDYLVTFTGATTASVVRVLDGTVTNVDFATQPVQIDGLDITSSASAASGDRFVITPFSRAASSIATAFSSPRGLAVASPVAATMSGINTGSLTVGDLAARSNPAPATVTLTFTGPGSYTRSDTGATVYSYTPGQPIEYSAAPPLIGWSLTLKGIPQPGDSLTVGTNPYITNDAGNARAMLNLRDLAMFDGAPLIDGYAGVMAAVGTKVESAKSAMTVSSNIATAIEKDRAGVSGVNLDEEAARMLQYQQAYQAAGKMMQVAQSMFDTLFQTLLR